MSTQIKKLTEIPSKEQEEFKEIIRSYRKKHIQSPTECVQKTFHKKSKLLSELTKKGNVSETITILREAAYHAFLENEAEFNRIVIGDLCHQLETPRKIIDAVITNNLPSASPENLEKTVREICGEYSGLICPYIYTLCLSNTQSRRSRAGKTFEAIIYQLYEIFGYSYNSQAKIGKANFQNSGLGKLVDSILPNIESFEQRRDKVVIGTMKTTLRERWQEVVEEVSRTGLPKIYLLTVDTEISKNKAEQIAKHNIVLVVLKEIKNNSPLQKHRNIISFEDYFQQEIPEFLDYWKNV